MKLRLSVLVALCAAFFTGAPPALGDSPGGSDGSATHYYLSLGDSLADRGGNPEDYADKLYAALHVSDPKLELVKLGCGGESAQSMIEGSVLPSVNSSCGTPSFYLHRYPHKTQLAEAVAFLHAHAGKVSLVTIDIGGNDVQDCLVVLNFSDDCLNGDLPALTTNLTRILAELRAAAGPDVPIVGMNYSGCSAMSSSGATRTSRSNSPSLRSRSSSRRTTRSRQPTMPPAIPGRMWKRPSEARISPTRPTCRASAPCR